MAGKQKEYRALVGMNYPHPESTKENPLDEVRVEAGDKLSVLPDDKWVTHQVKAENIEVWVDKQTENVRDPSEQVERVTGVVSRHADGGSTIVLREVGSE